MRERSRIDVVDWNGCKQCSDVGHAESRSVTISVQKLRKTILFHNKDAKSKKGGQFKSTRESGEDNKCPGLEPANKTMYAFVSLQENPHVKLYIKHNDETSKCFTSQFHGRLYWKNLEIWKSFDCRTGRKIDLELKSIDF